MECMRVGGGSRSVVSCPALAGALSGDDRLPRRAAGSDAHHNRFDPEQKRTFERQDAPLGCSGPSLPEHRKLSALVASLRLRRIKPRLDPSK